MFPAAACWVGDMGVGHLVVFCPAICSECSVHWWSCSPRVPGDHFHMVFSIWASCSSISPPHCYAQILSACSPPSSLSFAAFPTGTPCASGHLNHCDPLSPMPPCWPPAVTHLPAWTPQGCFLLACDCKPGSGLANQPTALPSIGFNYTFFSDTSKSEHWGEPQLWTEVPLSRLSFFEECPSDLNTI